MCHPCNMDPDMIYADGQTDWTSCKVGAVLAPIKPSKSSQVDYGHMQCAAGCGRMALKWDKTSKSQSQFCGIHKKK